jgi:hypothetical protein
LSAAISYPGVGATYPCWYDPEQPSRIVLVRGFRWTMLAPLFPIAFAALGLFSLLRVRSRR